MEEPHSSVAEGRLEALRSPAGRGVVVNDRHMAGSEAGSVLPAEGTAAEVAVHIRRIDREEVAGEERRNHPGEVVVLRTVRAGGRSRRIGPVAEGVVHIHTAEEEDRPGVDGRSRRRTGYKT